MPDTFIKVWRFQDAPQDLKSLSPHGGDEDWLALVPNDYPIDYIPWINFGMCDTSRHETEYGIVYIGAHA